MLLTTAELAAEVLCTVLTCLKFKLEWSLNYNGFGLWDSVLKTPKTFDGHLMPEYREKKDRRCR